MSKMKQIRLTTGMSQSEFAEYFHISINTLQSWERDSEPRIPPEHVTYMIQYILYLEAKLYKKKKRKQSYELER